MGERPEPVPQVVQAPADSVSARLDDVDDISQAIKSLRLERQLQEAQGKLVVKGKHGRAFPFIIPKCFCGMAYVVCTTIEGGSEMDVKLLTASCKCSCRLLFLLGASYFRLGLAYTEDGQFNRALKALHFACRTRNFTGIGTWRNFAGRSCKKKARKLVNLRDPKAAEFAWGMRRLTPPPKEAFFPKGPFEDQLWNLAGDVYFEAQRTFENSDVVIPHQEGEELKMAQEVEEELCRARSCPCFRFHMVHLPPRIVDNKWEKNLLNAIQCYSMALPWYPELASGDSESEDKEDKDLDLYRQALGVLLRNSVQEHAFALRKMGFACHEFGRRLAELGWHAKDEADKYFRRAIGAFHRGKDLPNFVLALCSRIEYHRKLAEFRETQQGLEGRKKITEEAEEEYQKALDLCDEGKEVLKDWGDGQHKEVDIEEAHTYLKLGMFLIQDGKQEEPNREGAEEELCEAFCAGKDLPNFELALCSRIKYHRKLAKFCETQEGHDGRIKFMQAWVEYQKALDLCDVVKKWLKVWGDGPDTERAHTYLKLGMFLMSEDKFYFDKQEKLDRKGQISAEEAFHEAIDLYTKLNREEKVAYARFQLGCAQRDRIVFDSVKSDVPRLEDKLIETWVEASKYYIDVRDTDMFLRIRMEHSELYLALHRKTHMNEGLEQALKSLLEGCRGAVFNGSFVCEEFIRKLLELLLTMCKVAKSQQNIASSSNSSKANNYELLAQMYKCALKLKGGNDYRSLWSMWDR